MNIRSLVIAPAQPYPPLGGGNLRDWQNVQGLLRCGDVAMFGLTEKGTPPDAQAFPGIAHWTTSRRDPKGKGNPVERLWKKAWPLRPGGHHSDQLESPGRSRDLADLVATMQPDVVVLEGVMMGRFLPVVAAPGRRIILDMHNIESQLEKDIASALGPSRLPYRLQGLLGAARLRGVEDRLCRIADRVWVCSSEDRDAFVARGVDGDRMTVIPNAVSDDLLQDGEREVGETYDLIFTASFNYPPNVNAARFLVDRLFPLVAERYPDTRLLLVGRHAQPFMYQAAERDARITVTGEVDDVQTYLRRSSLAVVPLFEGSGTRFKILEAFSVGLPAVSTRKGAEGLDLRHEDEILYAETVDEFVAAITRMREDPDAARQMADRGRDVLRERFTWSAVARRIERDVREMMGGRPTASAAAD